ncbi:MAG: 30S ribosomal protein S8 [Deferribacteraceae bacterium]|jgi:small subunit ribosomal protein S8|nr:30S ribosomal protein S8 [Deferribacteraceae bacterium]
MRLTDPIADMLTRIRNALMVNHQEVSIPYSVMKEKIITIFQNEGYVKGYRVSTEGAHKSIIVYLKYTESDESVIRGLKRISKPGGRVYVNSKNLSTVLGGLGNGVVSTSHGIKTVKQCLHEKVGGEYLCQIW